MYYPFETYNYPQAYKSLDGIYKVFFPKGLFPRRSNLPLLCVHFLGKNIFSLLKFNITPQASNNPAIEMSLNSLALSTNKPCILFQ